MRMASVYSLNVVYTLSVINLFINRLRTTLLKICGHKIFDYVILVFIVMSSVVLAMEGPGTDTRNTTVYFSLFHYFCRLLSVAFVLILTLRSSLSDI